MDLENKINKFLKIKDISTTAESQQVRKMTVGNHKFPKKFPKVPN